ncbi:NHL repeat-containing protein [Glutamicibacter sp. X7]
MPEGSTQPSKSITRRSVLALSVVAAGGFAGGALWANREGASAPVPESTPSPSPTPSPEPIWEERDPHFLAELTRGRDTGGMHREYTGVFPALTLRDVVPLIGLGTAEDPWVAATIIGPSHQLQIIPSGASTPAYTLSIPEDAQGEILSMTWDAKRKTLYLSVSGRLWAWRHAAPKSLAKLGDVPKASTLYDLVVDENSVVWGGTYPTGTVFNYTPGTQKIRVFPRMAADSDYVRRLALDPTGRLWVGTGSRNPRIFTFPTTDPSDRTEVQLPTPQKNGFVSVLRARGSQLLVTASGHVDQLVLDTKTRKWLTPMDLKGSSRNASNWLPGRDTYYTVVKGRLTANKPGAASALDLGAIGTNAPIELHATANSVLVFSETATGYRTEHFDLKARKSVGQHAVTLTEGLFDAHSLLALSDGNLYIGGFMGSGLSGLNPVTGDRWRSPEGGQVIHQVENMIEFSPTRCYLGSYGAADLISWDSAQKDDDNSYRRISRLSYEYHQSRPYGWAANSTQVYFGTVPDYGLAGGVFGMIDPEKDRVAWVLDGNGKGFIPGHSIIGLVADEDYVYGTTSVRNGYGIPDTEGPSQVFKFDVKTKKLVWQSEPVETAGALYSPQLVAGWLLAADIEGINVIDPRNGKLEARHKVSAHFNASRRPGWASAGLEVVGDGERVVHSASGTTTVLNFRTGTHHRIGGPGTKRRFGVRLASFPDGRVFATYNDTSVAQLDLEPVPEPAATAKPSAKPTPTA